MRNLARENLDFFLAPGAHVGYNILYEKKLKG